MAHAPIAYSTHYPPPTRYEHVYTESSFSATPTAHGGWSVFGLDSSAHVGLQQVNSSRHLVHNQVVDDYGTALSVPSMAWSRHAALGAWISNPSASSQSLKIAYFSGGKPLISTIAASGSQETPLVVPHPSGGFDVLFAWQRPGRNFDLYRVFVGRGGRHTVPHRLTRAASYAYSPSAVWDGRGHLDVMYMDACCQGNAWNLVFQRFSSHMRPMGPGDPVGRLGSLGSATPTQWGIDLRRDSPGKVWAAWGEDSGVDIARWSPDGKNEFVKFLGPASLDFSAPAVSLLLLGSGGTVYYTSSDALGAHLVATSFDARGNATSTQRVAYDSGGDAAYPVSALEGGTPRVIWQKFGHSGAVLEGSEYHQSIAPSLAERLGLGLGNSLANFMFLAVGSLAVAVPLTLVNILILAPLLLLWIPISRLVPDRLKWPSYIAIVAATLVLVFAVRSFANGWAFVLGPLGAPLSWLAVASGVFVGVWISRIGMKEREPAFRAAVMVLTAFYFVATMWALTGIEGQLSVI